MDERNLRIAFLVDAIRGRNGVGTYYEDLVAQLDDRGVPSILFCPSMDQPDPFQGVSMPLLGDNTQRLFLPKIRAVSRAIAEFRPSVLVVPAPGPYGILALYLARRRRIPLCFAFQTDYEQLFFMYWNRLAARPAMAACRWLHARFLKASSLIVTISKHMVEKADVICGREAHLVGTPLGLDYVRTPVIPASQDLRTVLFLGRLAKEKNLDVFLQAASDLPHIQFKIAGDGPLRAQVEASAGALPNLDYMGWLGRKEVVSTLDEVDMLVLPSKVEAFGTVAIEAMTRCRLVLTSPNCGVNSWPSLAPGLYTFDNDESLTDAIQRVADCPAADRRQKTAVARRVALQLNDTTIDHWLELLTQAACPDQSGSSKDQTKVA